MGQEREDLIAEARQVAAKFQRFKQLGLLPRDGNYYPAVFYPPLRSVEAMDTSTFFEGYRLPEDGLFSAYAHIPFCARRCAFCHIPVINGASEGTKSDYIDLLEREMDLWLRRFNLDRIPVRSISLGGGTPTSMSPALLERFLSLFTARLDRSACTQWAIDTDPATLIGDEGEERLDTLVQHGLDRVSFGVQSLNDNTLRAMNRLHDRAQVHEAVELAQKAGLKVNVELICGYPGESIETWLDIVEEAVGMGIDEIQIYRLKVVPYRESEGSISREFARHPERFTSFEETMVMLRAAVLHLQTLGYDETLRRFYSKTPGDYSHYLHDQMVQLGDQVAFGHTGYSLMGDRFGQNSRDARRYEEAVGRGELPIEQGVILDDETLVRRAFSMPLRYLKVDPEDFTKITGRNVHDVFKVKVDRLIGEGLIEHHAGGLRQTELGGLWTHEVAQQFHHPEYQRFPPSAFEDGPLNPYTDNTI